MTELGAPFVMSSAIGYTPLLLISSRFVDGSSLIERDTECYKDLVNHSPLILKLMVSLFSVVTAMIAELVVLGSVNLKPRRLSALRKWTVHGVS